MVAFAVTPFSIFVHGMLRGAGRQLRETPFLVVYLQHCLQVDDEGKGDLGQIGTFLKMIGWEFSGVFSQYRRQGPSCPLRPLDRRYRVSTISFWSLLLVVIDSKFEISGTTWVQLGLGQIFLVQLWSDTIGLEWFGVIWLAEIEPFDDRGISNLIPSYRPSTVSRATPWREGLICPYNSQVVSTP